MDALEVVQAFGDAWGAHDLDGALALITDDCLVRQHRPGPCTAPPTWATTRIRRAPGSRIFPMTPRRRLEAEETFAAGDRVVQRWCYRWEDGHVRGVDLFLVRDGKVAEKRSYVKG